MYNFSQGQIFIIFIIIGLCIGVFFDFFRALRKTIKTSDLVTYIEDIIFMASIGFIVVNTLLIINNGQIRFFIILAILFGISFYLLTISKICFILFQVIVKFFKKLIFTPFFYFFRKIKLFFYMKNNRKRRI